MRVAIALLSASLLTAGCVMGAPGFDHDDEDLTGSIAAPEPAQAPRPAVLAAAFDVEDTRLAMAALAASLDPQGAGPQVSWENPQSKRKGVIRPAGLAVPGEENVCRAFESDIAPDPQVSPDERRTLGFACRDKRGEWSLAKIAPRPKS